MGLSRRNVASLARAAIATLTLVAAVAVLRASPTGQTPPPAAQQPPPPGQQSQPPAQQAPPPGQQQPGQQQPVFRAGVKLVRVDVTVTGKGDQPVSDLTPGDFEVSEDGVPQKVEQLQFIRLDGRRPSGDETSLEIRSQDQAEMDVPQSEGPGVLLQQAPEKGFKPSAGQKPCRVVVHGADADPEYLPQRVTLFHNWMLAVLSFLGAGFVTLPLVRRFSRKPRSLVGWGLGTLGLVPLLAAFGFIAKTATDAVSGLVPVWLRRPACGNCVWPRR